MVYYVNWHIDKWKNVHYSLQDVTKYLVVHYFQVRLYVAYSACMLSGI